MKFYFSLLVDFFFFRGKMNFWLFKHFDRHLLVCFPTKSEKCRENLIMELSHFVEAVIVGSCSDDFSICAM